MGVAILAPSGAAGAQAGPDRLAHARGLASPATAACSRTRWRRGRSTSNPTAPSAHASAAWQGSRPDDAALLARIADQPQGLWLGEWRRDVRGTVAARVRAAAQDRRDSRSWWPTTSRTATAASTRRAAPPTAAPTGRGSPQMARGIGSRPGGRDPGARRPGGARTACTARAADGAQRPIRDAVAHALRPCRDRGVHRRRQPRVDARPPRSPAPARRRRRPGARLRRQRLRLRHHRPSRVTAARSRAALGGAPFVIDTSRNGPAPRRRRRLVQPAGPRAGRRRRPPTPASRSSTRCCGSSGPGESDGACNGGPPAGELWPEYALGLAGRAPAA